MTVCVSAPGLEDAELLQYLDGEADRRVVMHLEQCQHCRQRAQRLAQLQGRLTAKLYRLACPAPAQLGEYHLGMLSLDQENAIAQHLVECPHCAREVAQLEAYMTELAPDLEPSRLQQARERARILIAQLIQKGSGGEPRREPILAPTYAGIRGRGTEPYLYEADEMRISIEIQPDASHPGRRTILGLVLGLIDEGAARAHLWKKEELIATQPVDDTGSFVISNLEPGVYELILSSREADVHIQELEVA